MSNPSSSGTSLTQDTRQRDRNSVFGILLGVILGFYAFVDSFHLLTWNEGRSVAIYKKLQEGQKSFIPIASTLIDPKNDGKLV
jgi:hypothetical protein